MAKVAALLVSVLCLFFALSGLAEAKTYSVEGKVYCDPCRVQFVTSLSKFVEGADVSLVCRSQADGKVTYQVNGKTDKDGNYVIKAEEHPNDTCEVEALTSPQPETCGDPMDEVALVNLSDNGMSTDIRQANYIGFMTKEVAPECKKALEELGLDDEDDASLVQDPVEPEQEQAQPEPTQ